MCARVVAAACLPAILIAACSSETPKPAAHSQQVSRVPTCDVPAIRAPARLNYADLTKDVTYEVSRATPVAGELGGKCSYVLPAGGYFLVNGKRQQGPDIWYAVVVCMGPDKYNMWIKAEDLRDQEIHVMGEPSAAEEPVLAEPPPAPAPGVAASLRDDESLGTRAPHVAQTPGSDDIVYIVPMGRKYHRKECRMLKGEALPISRGAAEGQGYTRCGGCRP